MLDPDEFVQHVAAMAPVLTAPPGGAEYARPADWANAALEGNADRLRRHRPGNALLAVMGGAVAVVDVDTKNGADVERTRQLLEALGVRIFAEVLTPSGGRHYYIAGHPDLPTVHAREDRPAFTGHPGVEVISYGANVFLPGTTRAKYDGAGYVVLADNLEALADGGDPDGAETFAGWVADNRVSTRAEFTPAEPWSGEPPDARQAAYLAGTLRKMGERIGAMGPESGRNVAIFNAAMACGNFIAGAGMDESEAVATLLEAATRCGLVAEDGERSVLASIASGLNYGRKRPRAVPEPAETFAATVVHPPRRSEAAPAVARESLARCHETFVRWLGDEYDLEALDAVLAAAAVERLDGDPLWLLLVSGSGNAKTETVAALTGAGAVLTSTISSQGALLSATAKKERSADATGGLLRKMGERGVLVIKDVTSILSMGNDQRGEVLGALREVYDGSWSRNVGTDGGRTLDWAGRLVIIGAVTTAWDKAHAVIASMGDRFVLVRMDSSSGRQVAGRRAIGNTGHETQMRAELAEAVAEVLDNLTAPSPVTDAETEALLAAADLVTLARTGVEYDYRGDVIDAHAPEMPTRFAKQLAQVVRGGVAVGVERAEAVRLAIRCARDSMPPLRLAIVDDIAANPDSTTAEVRKRIGKPRATVDRQLQALHMLGVLEVDEEETVIAGKQVTRWRYRLAEGIDPTALDPKTMPEKSVPTPNPSKEGESEAETPRPPTDFSGIEPAPTPSTARRSYFPGRNGTPMCSTCDEPTSDHLPGCWQAGRAEVTA